MNNIYYYLKNLFNCLTPVLSGFVFLLFACEKEPLVETRNCEVSQRESHPKSEAFNDLLKEYHEKGLPGISLLIRDSSGLWIGSEGMADLEQDVPMRVCHISKVASITKPFMASLVMMLEKEGKLSLDDPISKYIKGNKLLNIENAKEVTIRQLMNHTSGIYDVISDDEFYLSVLDNPQKEWEHEELLEYVKGDNAYFPPGEDVQYSNSNYLLLSMVIERATRQTHFKVLKEKIIDPLSLSSTVYHPQQPLPANTAKGYFDLYNNGNILELSDYNTGNGNGYNGIYSTVKDLQVFIESLVRSKSLVGTKQLNKMQTFNRAETYREIGLGLMKDFQDHPSNTYAIGHGGSDLAYSGEMYYFPQEDYTMVTLVNYGTNGDSELGEVYEAYRKDVVSVLMN